MRARVAALCAAGSGCGTRAQACPTEVEQFGAWMGAGRSNSTGRVAGVSMRGISRGRRRGPSLCSYRAFIGQKNGQAHLCRSEEHTSELQSLMRISYAVFCLKKKKKIHYNN